MTNELSVRGNEVVDPEVVTPERRVTLFGTDDPVQVVELAGRVSKALSTVIDAQGLYTDIGGKKHVRVEGWTLCGSMLGVFPICVWTRSVEGGFEARVEARLRDGSLVGAAEAQCTRAENKWANRDDYAIRSMAQTRATSKAMRLPLGFIVAMAGYDPTPEEEMPRENGAHTSQANAPAHVPAPTPKAAAPPRTGDRTSGGDEFVVGEITEVKSIKKGEKDGEPWEVFAINAMTDTGFKFNGTAFDNDPNNCVANASGALRTKEMARIYFKRNGKYVNVTAVEPA